jgi:hypothetical protein
MTTKNSFGGGYGINRNLKAASHLGTAIPPHRNPTVKPGSGFSRAATGKSGNKHFAGVKSPGVKNG